MVRLDGHISSFKDFKPQLDPLKARRENSIDCMFNLLNGYKAIADGQFRQ